MIDVRTVAEIRQAEEAAFAVLPDGTLMQRAATALAVSCARLLADVRGGVVGARIVLLVGSGNNGADALYAGAQLAGRGARVDAVACGERLHEAATAALLHAGGRLADLGALAAADLVVDGILGIGGRGGLTGRAEQAAGAIDDCLVVAVDVPSGVDADSGAVVGTCIAADVTVTFGAVKAGLVTGPGRARSGAVRFVDIGLRFDEPASCGLGDALDAALWLPEPAEDDYKYRRGVAGIAAGSGPYPGAALLAVGGARHANAGMVRYLDRSDGLGATVVAAYPDVVVDGASPQEQTRADAWGCGSGFVGGDDDVPAVLAVLAAGVPVVLDAGALRVLAASETVRARLAERWHQGLPTVLTPHEGEFEALRPGALASSGRLAAARSAAEDLNAIVLLKGPGTVIATPGGSARIDAEGTAALATAGSGDVLTGITTSLLAGAWARGLRGPDAYVDPVAAAVWVHGRCGRLAEAGGPVTATDLVSAVRDAVHDARTGR